jgi:hypothetical protein
MSDEKPNGVSSLDEFRRAAEDSRMMRSVVVTLPSGARARLCKPTPTEMFLRTGRFPQSLAAKISPSEKEVQPYQAADVVEFARTQVELVEYVFVSPRIPAEAKPGIDISFEDIEFALQWARGEVTDSGQNLADFRGGRAIGDGTPNA